MCSASIFFMDIICDENKRTMHQCNKNVLFGVHARPSVRAIGDQTVCLIVMQYGVALLHKTFSRNPEFRQNWPYDNLTSNLHGGC